MSVKNVQITLLETDDDTGTDDVLDFIGAEKLSAFDMMATSLLVTDSESVIRYLNPAAHRLFDETGPYLSRIVPGFSPSGLVGKSLQFLDVEKVELNGFRQKMGDPKGTVLNLGEVSFGIRMTALRDGETVRGFFVELWDATPEMAIRDQVERLLHDLKHMARKHIAGEIDVFPDPECYDGIFAEVAKELTSMVRSHVDAQSAVIDVTQAFGKGDLTKACPAFPGKRAAVSDAIESMRANFRNMVSEIGRINTLVGQGELDVVLHQECFPGDFRSIADSKETLLVTLNNAFRALGVEVGQTSAAVEQMSSAARELATNSQVQSASVDEVSASAEETDTQVKSNAAAAGQANQLVTGAAAVAEEGKEKIGQMVQAMEGIRASSQDIAKIIKVIDEIAFQTNLLALNAAVEAARAGQHGRGFAVVAQEVRNLAGRSAKAARETGELIESAGARVQAGVKIADEASRAFASIAGDIDQVRSFMREIAVASDEQARGVAQINTAISEVAKTALVTSQQAEEVAARVAEMEQASERMHREVSRFQLRAQPAAVELPALDSLPPDIAAQVLALMKARTAPTPKETHPSHRSPDRDERGFKGF